MRVKATNILVKEIIIRPVESYFEFKDLLSELNTTLNEKEMEQEESVVMKNESKKIKKVVDEVNPRYLDQTIILLKAFEYDKTLGYEEFIKLKPPDQRRTLSNLASFIHSLSKTKDFIATIDKENDPFMISDHQRNMMMAETRLEELKIKKRELVLKKRKLEKNRENLAFGFWDKTQSKNNSKRMLASSKPIENYLDEIERDQRARKKGLIQSIRMIKELASSEEIRLEWDATEREYPFDSLCNKKFKNFEKIFSKYKQLKT